MAAQTPNRPDDEIFVCRQTGLRRTQQRGTGTIFN
jgi:hypothetical protein